MAMVIAAPGQRPESRFARLPGSGRRRRRAPGIRARDGWGAFERHRERLGKGPGFGRVLEHGDVGGGGYDRGVNSQTALSPNRGPNS